MKSLFGLNVTTPVVGSITYLPTSFPSFVAGISVESTGCPFTTNLAGCSGVIVIGAVSSPCVKTGLPVCSCPCFPSDVTGAPVGVTGVTSGVYFPFDVTGTLFPSESVAVTDTCTLTPLAFPVNVGSGSNVTTPVVGSIEYVPSPSTTTLPSALAPSSEYAAVVQSTFVPSGVLVAVFNSEKRSFPDLDV